ncbi:hypothetical protein CspeluHIS016_0404620 [Cutaneotrichosporon spelunceum]|uniref:Rhodanese domain-containing protein n=1 Tax=Cutaneotrichosporon spelunceum TaxID=1672016 RepID=A0AAD3TVF1_9TREE|nr:hypothetical protein CspeluHIS016_0404620 [Cutaneotrichosporon spelunceum]
MTLRAATLTRAIARAARPRVGLNAAISTPARALSTSLSIHKSSSPNMAAATLLHHHSPLSAPLFKEARDAWAQDPIIGYDEVKHLSQQPTDSILLVDVREPDENALGSIPSAVNLPLSRMDEALSVGFNPGKFQQEFAFKKPTNVQNIVFYCRSGRRSALACEVANRHGFLNTRNYVGSWLEWCENEDIDNNED